MLEILIVILIIAGISLLGMLLWRVLGGAARSRFRAGVRGAVVCLAAAVLVLPFVWNFSKSRHLQLFGGLVTRVETAEPVVALTFDDGPAAGYTGEILQILAGGGVRATFFVTGKELAAHPAEGRQLAVAGHELGNHSFSHRRMLGMNYSTVREEIEQTDKLIRATGYTGTINFRPPYGKRFIVLPCYLKTHQRRTIFWDIEPESYQEVARDSDALSAYIMERVQPGSIILLHVMAASREVTRAALPGIIAGLQERGYRFETVSRLLGYAESGYEFENR